ncbi:undecaprenyl-phosphate glucose phosphotransferase [Candidatus Margulisiibacteriota bacterium]
MFRKIIEKYYISVLLDVAIINLSFIVAYYLRFSIFPVEEGLLIPPLSQFYSVLVFISIVWLALFKLLGLYDRKNIISMEDQSASVVGAVTAGIMILLAMLFLYRGFWISRQVLLFAWVFTILLMIFVRFLSNAFQRYLYKMGKGIKRTLIIGAGEIGRGLALRIKQERELGYEAVGFLDDDQVKVGKEFHGIKVLGTIKEADNYIQAHKIDEVNIATVKLPYQRILDIVTESEDRGIEFKLVPGFLEIIASRISTDDIGGIPLLSIKEIGLLGFKAFLKRAFDLLFAALVLLILSPLFLIVAAAIKVDSRGPIFFKQKRIGRDGKAFDMYKFRSMIKGAEEQFDEIAEKYGTGDIKFKAKEDPRMTRVGKFIRKFSMDELPQVFNVIRGEMSLVGPRPPVPREHERYTGWHKKRLRVNPGMTGLWQVSGRSELPFEDMVRLDVYYIENWSLWLDLKILLRTIPTVLFGSGAY